MCFYKDLVSLPLVVFIADFVYNTSHLPIDIFDYSYWLLN